MSSVSSISCCVPSPCDLGRYGGRRSPIWFSYVPKPTMVPSTETSVSVEPIDCSQLGIRPVEVKQEPGHASRLSTQEIKSIVLSGTFVDIIVGKESIYSTLKGNKKDKDKPLDPYTCSRLESIKGIKTGDINCSALRAFCSRNGVRISGKATKMDCAQAIVECFDDPSKRTPSVSPKKKNSQINRLRYINVIFSDECRKMLSLKGESLTKDELTEGIKTDEEMHKKFIMEYNDPDKHNEFAWPNIREVVDGDPKFGSKQGPILWRQSATALNLLLKDYEYCLQNLRMSGNHKEFGNYDPSKPTLPFSNFINNNSSMLYVHEFCHIYPNVLEKATGQLPGTVFTESIQGYDIYIKGQQLSTPGKSKRSSSHDILESYQKMYAKKARSTDDFFLGESLSNAKNDIRSDKAEKKQLLIDKAREKKLNTRHMIKKYNDYKKKRDVDDDKKCDEDDDFDTDSLDSLVSVFEECYDLDKDIEFAEARKARIQAQLIDLSPDKANS